MTNRAFPSASEISVKAYKEFANQFNQEKALADRLVNDLGLPPETAALAATLMQADPGKCDEKTAVKLAELGAARLKEIGGEQSTPLATYRVTRELQQMQEHHAQHGALPTGEKLAEIQIKVQAEVHKLEVKIQNDRQLFMQREQQTVHQRMRV